MDAISAATTKKDSVRKRKRALTAAKDAEASTDKNGTKDGVKPVAPLKFYQDTLDDSESNKDEKSKDETEIKKETDNDDDSELKIKKVKKEGEQSDEETDVKKEVKEENAEEKSEEEEEVKKVPGPGCGPDGPPGVLTIHRRRGPKKSLKWKPQESLEEIRYFELDENERVNVTKTFVDMKQMERVNEREALLSKKLNAEDVMTEQTPWAQLIEVDDVPPWPQITSKEKEVQIEREKTVLKTIYFSRAMIPDSPSEPDVITFQNVEPQIIPLFDVTGNPDAVHDFTTMPWPEPKGSPTHKPSLLDNIQPNFSAYPQFNGVNWPMAADGMPQMGVGNTIPPINAFGPMMSMPNGMNMPQIPFQAPNAIGPNFMPTAQGFINNFTPAPMQMMNDNNRMGPRMNNVPPGNWFGNNNSNNNNWQPMNGPNNNSGGGRAGWLSNNSNNNNNNNRRLCKAFERGYCRHGNSCKFLHPGINGPRF